MALTKIEKETIILFNEGESTVEILTHNQKLKNKLKIAAEKNPETFVKTDTDRYGGVAYSFPKKLLQINLKQPLTAEQQEKLNEKMSRLRNKRNE